MVNENLNTMKISNMGYNPSEFKTGKPNILTNSSVVDQVSMVFETVNSAICHTIGPYGTDTLIQSYFGDEVPLYPTRDGFTILQRLSFTQAIPNAFLKIIREISEYMQRSIGDSTSSGNPIAANLYHNLISLYNNDDNKDDNAWKFSPIGIANIMKLAVEEIITGITDNPKYQINLSSLKTDEEKIDVLTRLGTVSGNNNFKIGSYVANLYKNKLDGSGSVRVILSDTEETYTKPATSFDVSTGLLDFEAMVNTASRTTCELEEPNVIIFEHILGESDIPAINRIIKCSYFDNDKPLVFVAPGYGKTVVTHLIKAIRGQVFDSNGEFIDEKDIVDDAKLTPVKLACITLTNKSASIGNYDYDDLIVMVNAIPFTDETGIKLPQSMNDEDLYKYLQKHFGNCKQFTGGYADCSFDHCTPDDEIRLSRLDDLEKQLQVHLSEKEHINERMINHLEYRKLKLMNKVDYIFVGGNSKKVKFGDKLIYDDVVSAIDSAIKDDGVSIGGNIAISHYIHINHNEIVETILSKIHNSGYNITAGTTNIDEIRKIISDILESIEHSFGQAYRYALFNMYQNTTKTFNKWKQLISSSEPKIYNSITGMDEKFLPFDKDGNLDINDTEKFTTVIVPKNTDKCLLTIITEVVSILIKISKMLTVVDPTMDLHEIRISQMKNSVPGTVMG